MDPCQSANPFSTILYDSKERFIGYWHQIAEIVALNPESVLEVGIGNGFVSGYLRQKGVKVRTLDIMPETGPDAIADILALPLRDASVDVAVCCQVLEHIPFEYFGKSLSELARVSRRGVILSLPDCSKVYPCRIQIPFIGQVTRLVQISKSQRGGPFCADHFWEISRSDYPLKRLINEIESAGFSVAKTYRLFESPHFRFFVLRK